MIKALQEEYFMYREWKKNSNKGVAMIVCITVISILVVFCFSLLLVTYTLYASQNKNSQSDRNAEACKSLSVSLRQELVDSNEDSNLYKYIRYNVLQDSWPYYAPEETGHEKEDAFRYFKLDKANSANIEGYPSDIEICIYWMPSEQLTEVTIAADPENGIEETTKIIPARRGTRLFVEICCRSGSQSYTITSEYQLGISKIIKSNLKAKSDVMDLNPARNTIDRDEIWKWKFIGSE